MGLLDFSIATRELGRHACIISLAGEFDLYCAPEVGRVLLGFAEDDTQEIVVDLLDVPFIDSTALGVLVEGARRLHRQGGQLTVVSDDRNILKLIDFTGASRFLRVRTSLAETLRVARTTSRGASAARGERVRIAPLRGDGGTSAQRPAAVNGSGEAARRGNGDSST